MKNTALLFGLFTLFFSSSVSALELSNTSSQNSIQKAIEIRNSLYLKKIQKRALRKELGFEAVLLERSAPIQRNSTNIKRKGALKYVPYYGKRRYYGGDRYSKIRVNSKQSFRKRAINYYIENGNGKVSDLLDQYGRNYKNRTAPNRLPSYLKKNNAALAKIKSNLRRQNRRLRTFKTVPTGHQKSTYRRGDSSRNYFLPFLKNTQTQ